MLDLNRLQLLCREILRIYENLDDLGKCDYPLKILVKRIMSFSDEWENVYRSNDQMSVWPWSDLVSLMHRYCKSTINSNGKVLELGCGAGANIPFFLAMGMDYHAIEGSQTIVDHLHGRFPELRDNIVQGDFTAVLLDSDKFDVILDRAALTHNSASDIHNTLEKSLNSLTDQGTFLGIDWFSTKHSDIVKGQRVDDAFTYSNFPDGQFYNVGKVHFSDKDHLKELFRHFDILSLQEKLATDYGGDNPHTVASWNIVGRKSNV
jgi:phospholipid N-methyltransferase